MRDLRTAAAVALGCLLLAGPVQGQAVEEVDRAVAELGRFVLRQVPDRPGVRVSILPFLSDRNGRVLLGDRLSGELELFLAAELGQARTSSQAAGESTYTVSGELQAYPTVIRLVCRVFKPDGELAGGLRVDLRSTPELAELLSTPSGTPPSSWGDGRPSSPAGPRRPDMDLGPGQADPFEPDDQPGFEVELSAENGFRYDRYLDAGDLDRFRFYMPQEGPAVLEVRTGVDLQLLLFQEGANLPFEVASGRGGDSLRLERTLQEGYYIVELLAFDVNIQGWYSLSLGHSTAAEDVFEPDNTLAEAAALAPGAHQQRVLQPGDSDWVELAYDSPGFYVLYTTGETVDTRIALFAENGHELLADQDSGEGSNAFVAVFLGVRRVFARLDASAPRDSGSYGLSFERAEPRQLYPDGAVQNFPLGANPALFQLRILQSARYLTAARDPLRIFSLPSMRLLENAGADGLLELTAGDYLLVVAGSQAGMSRLCVAPADQAEACRRRLSE